MITSVSSNPKINNIHAGIRIQRQLPVQNSDVISFSGLCLSKTNNKGEIKELIDLLYDSYRHSMLQGKTINQNWFQRTYDKINAFIGKKLMYITARTEDSVVGVIKDSQKKIQGGYSMFFDNEESIAIMNFITLSPQLKHSKTSKNLLFQMCEDIYNQARKNKIFEIVWVKEKNNKTAQKLFEKLNPYEKYKQPLFNEQECVIFVDDIPKILKDLANKYDAKVNI